MFSVYVCVMCVWHMYMYVSVVCGVVCMWGACVCVYVCMWCVCVCMCLWLAYVCEVVCMCGKERGGGPCYHWTLVSKVLTLLQATSEDMSVGSGGFPHYYLGVIESPDSFRHGVCMDTTGRTLMLFTRFKARLSAWSLTAPGWRF